MEMIAEIITIILLMCIIISLDTLNKKMEKLYTIAKELRVSDEYTEYIKVIKEYAEKKGKKGVFFEVQLKPHDETENTHIDKEDKVYFSGFPK